jgi:hypothetical protein
MMTQRTSGYSHPHIIRSIFHHCQADVHQACPGYDGAVIDGHYRNAGLRCSCPCHVKAEAAATAKIKIGFTGTRNGTTEAQYGYLRGALTSMIPKGNAEVNVEVEAHHGDCVGADCEFHVLLREVCPAARIIAYPGLDNAQRAFSDADLILEPRPLLDRNLDIVKAVDFLFAAPKEDHMVLRSGTWATVRYAVRRNVPQVIVVKPDGMPAAGNTFTLK